MALSNTAVPKYYGMFRDAVIRGEIPVCREIEMEMNRIDDLIAHPGIYYDDQAVELSLIHIFRCRSFVLWISIWWIVSDRRFAVNVKRKVTWKDIFNNFKSVYPRLSKEAQDYRPYNDCLLYTSATYSVE